MKHLNEGLIILNPAFVMYAIKVQPSVPVLFFFVFFTNVESDPNRINLPNSQSYLHICTNHIIRLTSASTEMHEQCLFGNALCLLKTGVSNYILNFGSASLSLHLSLQFHCTSLLLNIFNQDTKKLHDPCTFACAYHVILLQWVCPNVFRLM